VITGPPPRSDQLRPAQPDRASCAHGGGHDFQQPSSSDTWCAGCRLRARYREADGRWYWLHDDELWSAAPADGAGYRPPDLGDAQLLDFEQLDITTTAAEAYELGYLARVLQEDQLG
jgi:hypothetical protein